MNASSALRETDIVAAIGALVGTPSRAIVLGIGDDAAAWQPSRSSRSVITSDMLVEDVHFARTWMSMRDIGWRAMAANASDIAAMGARPVLATVALGIPPTLAQADLLELYRGLQACAQRYGFAIVGGDLSRAPVLTIAITAVGEVRPTHMKTRVGARPGDVIAVTGPLGASRAGLTMLRDAVTLPRPLASEALCAYRTPEARVAEGRWLGASRNVHAMMDCSDGISTDLARLCAASAAGATVTNVPIAKSAEAIASALGVDPTDFALAGGEDFELLVAIAPRAFSYLADRFVRRFGRPLERLGSVRADGVVTVRKEGRDEPLLATGWDHFA